VGSLELWRGYRGHASDDGDLIGTLPVTLAQDVREQSRGRISVEIFYLNRAELLPV
jgi:hypothetical protein